MNRGPVVVRSQRLLARLSHTVSGHVASRLLSVVARAVAGSIAGRVARCAHSRAVGRRARGDDRRQVDDRYTTVSKHDTVIDSAYVANMVLTYATRRGESAGVARCFGVRAACASATELVARAQPQLQAPAPGPAPRDVKYVTTHVRLYRVASRDYSILCTVQATGFLQVQLVLPFHVRDTTFLQDK